jgi:hypothetical protein
MPSHAEADADAKLIVVHRLLAKAADVEDQIETIISTLLGSRSIP